jgi:hypothetical protein
VSAVRECVALWGGAAGLAALGTAVLFEAAAGVNWGLWTIGAAGAVAVWTRRSGAHLSASLLVVLGLAGMLGMGAAVTADGFFHVIIAAAVLALLAMAVLLAGDPRWARVNLPFMLSAPFVAPLHGLAEVVRRATELAGLVTTRGNRPPLRGAALALPVVALFGLILANADPVLATLRDDLVEALTRLAFVPRLKFFATLLIGALGGGGIIFRRQPVRIPGSAAPAPGARLGDTERLIILGSVVALFAAFLLLQLSYLFGNAPARIGSGVTFAEYARRGFAELTTVATLCTLLVVLLERWAARGARERWAHLAAVAVILEVELLLLSALRRLWLYEAAYGFTTLRLYAHAYMVVVALLLVLLGSELWRGLEPGRAARRAAGVGALALIALTCWNHEAWIVRKNVARYVLTGHLDTQYLLDLSPNAVPAIVESLSTLPEGPAGLLRESLQRHYSPDSDGRACRWFEWNLRRRQAAKALRAAGLLSEPVQFGARLCT